MHGSSASCFDDSRAGLRLRWLRMPEIVDLLPLTHGDDTIESYRAAMSAGARFPPIAVFPLFGRYVIADGHKRYQAALRTGLDVAPVEVWTFRRVLADQWRQVRANGRKNVRIVRALFVDRAEAAYLLRTTILHWIRVARCVRLWVVGKR